MLREERGMTFAVGAMIRGCGVVIDGEIDTGWRARG